MKVLAKLKEKNSKLEGEKIVLLLWKKGNGIEYSVHTEIVKTGEYIFGHYFNDFWDDKGLENALKFYNDYEKNYFL